MSTNSPKGTKSYTASVQRPRGRDGKSYTSRHLPNKAAAVAETLGKSGRARGICGVHVQEWEASGDGSWMFVIFGGNSWNLTLDEAKSLIEDSMCALTV
jgi:hypothetical protein